MGLLPDAAQNYRWRYLYLGAKPDSALTALDASPTMKTVGFGSLVTNYHLLLTGHNHV